MITQDDLQAVVDATAFNINLPLDAYPLLTVKDIKTGRASFHTSRISIPRWALERSDDYAIYYAIHETCHFSRDSKVRVHNRYFKALEKKALSRFGITIEYARAYPKRLYNNGELVYEKKKRVGGRRYQFECSNCGHTFKRTIYRYMPRCPECGSKRLTWSDIAKGE